GDCLQVFAGRSWIPVKKIFPDRLIKKNRILRNQGQDGAKAPAGDLPNVLPSYKNRARIRFVQASRQKANRALPGTIQTYDCDGFACFNEKAHFTQHWAIFVV